MSPVKQEASQVSFANGGGPKGWRCEDTPKGRPQRRNTAMPKARAVRTQRGDHAELRGGRTASALCAHRRPEGLKWRAHEAKRSAQPRNTAQASAQGGAKMRNDHCELRGWQWRGSKLSRHPLVKKTFLTSGFFPALAAVTPDRSRRGRCCPRPGGCPAPGRCGGFPPCGRARGSRRPAFPRALRRRSAG